VSNAALSWSTAIEVIDSELRLLAAVRRTARELTGRTPSSALIDGLPDERDRAARAGQPEWSTETRAERAT
jgi:hypothetical protein